MPTPDQQAGLLLGGAGLSLLRRLLLFSVLLRLLGCLFLVGRALRRCGLGRLRLAGRRRRRRGSSLRWHRCWLGGCGSWRARHGWCCNLGRISFGSCRRGCRGHSRGGGRSSRPCRLGPGRRRWCCRLGRFADRYRCCLGRRCRGRCCRLRRRRTGQRHVALHLAEHGRTDTRYLGQVVHRLEGTVLGSVVDDRLGLRRADAAKVLSKNNLNIFDDWPMVSAWSRS